MPKRLCLEAGCPNPVSYRGRCTEHARVNDREINRAGRKVYRSKRWLVTRRSFLFNHPICQVEGCNTIATDVHHRQDIADGGDPYASANLEALCHAHHARITRARQQPSHPSRVGSP